MRCSQDTILWIAYLILAAWGHFFVRQYLCLTSQTASCLRFFRPVDLSWYLFLLLFIIIIILIIALRIKHWLSSEDLSALHIAHKLRDTEHDWAETAHFWKPVKKTELQSIQLVESRIYFKGHSNLKRSIVNENARGFLVTLKDRFCLCTEAKAEIAIVVLNVPHNNFLREIESSRSWDSEPAYLRFSFEHPAWIGIVLMLVSFHIFN